MHVRATTKKAGASATHRKNNKLLVLPRGEAVRARDLMGFAAFEVLTELTDQSP